MFEITDELLKERLSLNNIRKIKNENELDTRIEELKEMVLGYEKAVEYFKRNMNTISKIEPVSRNTILIKKVKACNELIKKNDELIKQIEKYEEIKNNMIETDK
ncbi:hypothetical protein TCON_1039 [Astathelohania contejeani]|uniref:Uncharacterized protein n=1 Tax=Astathelohania contejeani TaxID=164912 RepID=A0ABQ7I004_9MICR|nr:hypothetical protein TCON_1039 [Thelohania contejeani]